MIPSLDFYEFFDYNMHLVGLLHALNLSIISINCRTGALHMVFLMNALLFLYNSAKFFK